LTTTNRRALLAAAPVAAALLAVPTPAAAIGSFQAMADEKGYFPVQDSQTERGFSFAPVPAVRSSTPQAVLLAEHLSQGGAVFFGAFWCPHCRSQRETMGREALSKLKVVECDKNGCGYDGAACEKAQVKGYPTWVFADGTSVSGEVPLVRLAELSGYGGKFDPALEPELRSAGVRCGAQ